MFAFVNTTRRAREEGVSTCAGDHRFGLRRLGLSGDATDFFDEHVEADAVHEAVAAVDLADGLVRQDPSLCGDVLWGARCLARVEADWGQAVVGAQSSSSEAGARNEKEPVR